MINKIKQSVTEEIREYATKNIIKKLQKQGVDYKVLRDEEFEELVNDEMKILKADTKKVGLGIGIGLAISMLTGI
jgi:hypothetical protein